MQVQTILHKLRDIRCCSISLTDLCLCNDSAKKKRKRASLRSFRSSNYKPQVKPKLLHSPMVISNLPSSGFFSWASDWKGDACLLNHAKNCEQWILSKDLFCLSILSCLLQVPDASSLMCLFCRLNFVFKTPYSTHLKNHGLRMQGHHIYGMKQCKVQNNVIGTRTQPNHLLFRSVSFSQKRNTQKTMEK